MQGPGTASKPPRSAAPSAPYFTLNRKRLDGLRRAHGIESETDLAKVIGVARSTLWRVSQGEVRPTADFMAATCAAFPSASFESLFRLHKPTDEDAP